MAFNEFLKKKEKKKDKIKKAAAVRTWHKQFTKALQYSVMQAVKENLVLR